METYLVESGEGPARKYYHLTEGGREYQKRLKGEWFEFVEAVARVLGEYDVWDPKRFRPTASHAPAQQDGKPGEEKDGNL